jgi:hypothetical protein
MCNFGDVSAISIDRRPIRRNTGIPLLFIGGGRASVPLFRAQRVVVKSISR